MQNTVSHLTFLIIGGNHQDQIIRFMPLTLQDSESNLTAMPATLQAMFQSTQLHVSQTMDAQAKEFVKAKTSFSLDEIYWAKMDYLKM